MHVGQIIRRLRKESNMTLLELSEKSGIALATLSRIENGKMTGTLESHMKICATLGVALPELYKNLPTSTKDIDFQAKPPKPSVLLHNRKSASEMLVSNVLNKKMLPAMVRIGVGGRTNSEGSKFGTEKFIYVLDGKIDAIVGEEKYNLVKGDTLYFAASIPHYFKNTGKGESRLLVVTSPPA